MHYDALIHREITTHIARYISNAFNQNLFEYKNEDNHKLCYDIIQSIINKIDYQIGPMEMQILNKYKPVNRNFDIIENLNEKEKNLLYLLDYYENSSHE